jgi:hypothetical protein
MPNITITLTNDAFEKLDSRAVEELRLPEAQATMFVLEALKLRPPKKADRDPSAAKVSRAPKVPTNGAVGVEG